MPTGRVGSFTLVLGAGDGGVLIIEPSERNISYRQAEGVGDLWALDAHRRDLARGPSSARADDGSSVAAR